MIANSTVPCGIAIPQVFIGDEPVDMALVRDFVARAEALGYDSVWVQEQIIGQAPVLEPLALLSYVAAVTSDIRMGAAVIITTTRNPVLLAKQIATVDAMSGGRLIPGIALGGRPSDYGALDGPPSHRVTHFLEGLRLMRALWSQETVDFDGRFWQLEGAWIAPRPAQQPLPIWFGGRHPDQLRRAVDHGDGWIGAGSTTTAQFSEHVRIVQRRMDETGRDPASFPIAKRVYVALDDDRARAERRLRDWFGVRYAPRPQLGSQVSVWGSAAQCVEGLQAVLDAGAQMLMLNHAFDHVEHLDALAEEVVPHLEPTTV